MSSLPQNLYDLSAEALQAALGDMGEKPFRARQIYRHLYVNDATSIGAMTDLPQKLRDRLASAYTIGDLALDRLQEGDRGLTRKAAFRLPSGEIIESVLMVYPDRATVCVSSQAGCAIRCSFCATGKLGLLKNLSSGQIIEQVLWARRELARMGREGASANLTNIVFMGMGEPFHNYDAWWEACTRLNDPGGCNIGARNFTVSTSGLIPGIRRLAESKLQINLAISLHAPDDTLRTELMPINKAYPIMDLLEASRDYALHTGRRVSFEYVLLEQTNDRPEHAEALGRLLRNGPLSECPQLLHVNLIPWNPVPGTPLARSNRERVNHFQRILREHGIPCTVRVERGIDIAAACGQLAGASGRDASDVGPQVIQIAPASRKAAE